VELHDEMHGQARHWRFVSHSTLNAFSGAAFGPWEKGEEAVHVGSMGSGAVKDEAHGDHLGELEAVLLEKGLRLGADAVCEQGDAAETLLMGEIDGVLQQTPTVTLAAVLGVDDDVLHQHHEAAFCRADGEEQIHHAENLVVRAQHEDAPTVWLLQNETQTMLLLRLVWAEVLLLAEEGDEQLHELGEVFDGGRLDTRLSVRMGHAGRITGAKAKAIRSMERLRRDFHIMLSHKKVWRWR